MKERTQFIHDSFVDYKGKEHHFVICAYSKLLPKTAKEVEGIYLDPDIDKDAHVSTFTVSYADSFGCLDNYDAVVKSVSIGVSICNPEDEFNYVVGCKKAQARAKNSNATLYATKSGMINTTMVTGLLTQEAEYLKNNPDVYIKGYEESKRAYLEKQKKADIFTALPEQAKDTINYLRNCSKQLANNIMKFVNE